jgi:hypothetical protein
MSEKLFYVRMRGRVSGPFSVTQLQALYQRGQLGRFHEVSEDRQSWATASTLGFLFPPAPGGEAVLEVGSAAPASFFTQKTELGTWYYLDAAGQAQGPVSREQLDELRRNGGVSGQSLVYEAGMAAWTPLDQLAPAAVAVAVPLDAESAAGLSDGGPSWRRVRAGVTLLIVSMFVWAGAIVLLVSGLVAAAMTNPGPPFALLIFCYGILLAARIFEAVGDGLLAAAPATSSGKGLAVAAFVLALVWLLFFLLVVLLWAAAPGSSVSAGRTSQEAWAVLVVVGWLVVGVLDAVRLVLVQRFLQAVAARWQAPELARTLAMLIVISAVFWGLLVIAAGVGVGMAWRGPPEPGALVVVLVLFWVIALCAAVLALFWFVRFVIALFQVRALIGRAALHE